MLNIKNLSSNDRKNLIGKLQKWNAFIDSSLLEIKPEKNSQKNRKHESYSSLEPPRIREIHSNL